MVNLYIKYLSLDIAVSSQLLAGALSSNALLLKVLVRKNALTALATDISLFCHSDESQSWNLFGARIPRFLKKSRNPLENKA